ncbi:uncharacterized protein [Primulina eburnea]|uniref:uncharacterized protein isoform X2 n=1 Tax=Primulina eburnea TaxID=1245227 RepID=UPI003C6CAC5F
MQWKTICVGWKRWIFLLPAVVIIPHMLSVLEFQKLTNSGDLRSEKRVKFDHLVLGPAAGEGLPDRLHCQGTKALNKTSFGLLPNDPNSGEHVAFVSMFAAYDSAADGLVSGRPPDYVTVGNASYNKVTMPKSNIFILTDPASELRLHRDMVTIQSIQGEYSRDKLMLQRIRSYIAFLEIQLKKTQKREQVSHFIFTDSDIAVVNDLGHIFTEYPNFDLALTFRNNHNQPLNSGLIAVRGTAEAIQRGMIFLHEVLEVYSLKFMKASRMLGDQLALAWIVKSDPNFNGRRFSRREAFLDKIGGASVLFLPCSSYNWTPPEGAGQFHGMPLDVKVVHFKGSRKRLMLEAWNFWSSYSDMSDMLCLILKSGRTKYDF